MPKFAIHHDNSPVMLLNHEAQSCLYIGKLWAHRHSSRVRSLIRAHLDRIRRWRGIA